MRNWTGAITAVLGAWLFYSALAHRRRVLAARRRDAIFGELGGSRPFDRPLATFGAILRPIIIFGLGYFALKVTLVYFLLGAGRFLSLFDLVGVIFLLAAYGTWLVLQTSYREAAERPLGRGCVPDAAAEDPMPNIAAPASRERMPVLDPQS